MALFQSASKVAKAIKVAFTAVLSLPIFQVVFFEAGPGFDFLQAHNHLAKFYAILIAIVGAFIGGGLAGGFKEYKNLKWSETVQGETRYNPAYAWFIASVVFQTALILLFE